MLNASQVAVRQVSSKPLSAKLLTGKSEGKPKLRIGVFVKLAEDVTKNVAPGKSAYKGSTDVKSAGEERPAVLPPEALMLIAKNGARCD